MSNPLEGQGFHTDPSRINRNGRPKGSRNRSTIVREIAEMISEGRGDKSNIEVATMEVMIKAMGGDVQAWEKIMDSAYGKVTDKIEAEVKAEVTTDVTSKVLSKLPTQELEALLEPEDNNG